jgi:hypothetical protein
MTKKNLMKFVPAFIPPTLFIFAYIFSKLTAIPYEDSVIIFAMFPSMIIFAFVLKLSKINKIIVVLLAFITVAIIHSELSLLIRFIYFALLMTYMITLLYIEIKKKRKEIEKKRKAI